jgi:hypothetical protein
MDGDSKTTGELRQILQNEVATWLPKGYQIQTMTDTQAILTRKKKIKVLTHVILAILTVGIWLIIPLIQLINRKQQTLVISVEPSGKLKWKQVA